MTGSDFTARFFASNRERLRQRIEAGCPIVIAGNGNLQRNGDVTYPFRQDSTFWYFTGLERADLTLVIGAKGTYVIVPELTAENDTFDGAYDASEFARRSGIVEFVPARAGWQRLKADLARVRQVAVPGALPEYMARQNFYTSPLRRRLITRLKRLCPGVHVQDIRSQVAAMRVIKQPAELKALQRAIDITADTLAEVCQPEFLESVQHEYELAAAIDYGFRRRGASGVAFDSIVAAGGHTTTLHHFNLSGTIKPGDLLVLDTGAEVENYAADITRTVSSRPATDRQQAIHEAVRAVQKYAFGLIKPGALPVEYEKAVAIYMGQQLRKLGIIRDDSHESIRRYFPHATSHFLGLDAHDAGDYRAPYQPGMVITVEPGIYVPEEGIGVRIEDDVLITETGIRILSEGCPRDLF